MIANIEQLKNEWLAEQNAGIIGWDWSRLDGRTVTPALPWDYREVVRRYLRPEHQLLDMGTGGGEVLLSLGHPHNHTSVTEGWEPNLKLCREKLAPLGIRVEYWSEPPERLPFENESFDVVVNRHESYDAAEIKRVLKPNGVFITQQVGGENNRDLSEALIDGYVPNYPEHYFAQESAKFAEAGFEIAFGNESIYRTRYLDIGAVVYSAAVLPWEFTDFSVENCMDRLCVLQEKLERDGYVSSREHRFIFVARK